MKQNQKFFKETGTKRDSLALLRGLAAATALITALVFSFAACGGDDDGDPALTGTVTIKGTAAVGQMLTADTALEGSGTISYQWKRADTSGGAYSNIAGAAAQTYTLAAADRSKFLKVAVTRAGYSGSKESEAKGPVAAASVTTTAANLASVLTGLAANTADSPYTIALAEGTNISNDWEAIYTEIRWRVSEQDQKYIILDLSACTATGNTITIGTGGDGTGNHPGNGFNIIGMIEHIKGVVLPDTLTSIGDDACYGCGNLTSVVIGNSVTSIGERAFNCTGLKTIVLPEGLTKIWNGAFSECAALTSVTLPSTITAMGYAFSGCSALTTVTIPDSVETIDGGNDVYGERSLLGWAFSGCGKLNLAAQARLRKIKVVRGD